MILPPPTALVKYFLKVFADTADPLGKVFGEMPSSAAISLTVNPQYSRYSTHFISGFERFAPGGSSSRFQLRAPPKSTQPGSGEFLEGIEKHISNLDGCGCMRLLFDIAILPDIRNQWSTDADVNLKKIAARFRIDTAAITKSVRAQAKHRQKSGKAKTTKGGAA